MYNPAICFADPAAAAAWARQASAAVLTDRQRGEAGQIDPLWLLAALIAVAEGVAPATAGTDGNRHHAATARRGAGVGGTTLAVMPEATARLYHDLAHAVAHATEAAHARPGDPADTIVMPFYLFELLVRLSNKVEDADPSARVTPADVLLARHVAGKAA